MGSYIIIMNYLSTLLVAAAACATTVSAQAGRYKKLADEDQFQGMKIERDIDPKSLLA